MWRLDELAKLVGGTVTSGPDSKVSGSASISFAKTGDLTFVTSPSYLKSFENCPASAAVIPPTLTPGKKPCIQVDQPEVAFATIVKLMRNPVERTDIGISRQAIVSPSAKLAEDVSVYAGAVIMDNVEIGRGSVVFPNVTIMEGCRIGAQVKIFPNSVLYEGTEVGDRSIIHAGVVLGAFGFGYSTVDGRHQLSAQLGSVKIASDVEIGANTTIDRGSYDDTFIDEGTKIDDLVMIGHNCQVGKHNLLCSQVGIAGSCQTGDYVVMGGQVGMADHLKIGSNVSVGAQSGLMHNIESNQKILGSPGIPAREEMQLLASRARLPEMRKTLKRLERQVMHLQESIQAMASDADTKAA
jgi:UDP-3-O-[3-hydroxymyristoyl] glucosamine N-acyltransferase